MTDNWGRWGENDQRGTLNHIDEAVVRAAAGLVVQGRFLSLAQPIFAGMTIPGHRAGVMHFMGRDGGDYAAGRRRPGGFQVAEDTIVMPIHVGTHMDALCHCWRDETLFNGVSQDEVRSNGAARLGIDTAGPVVTRGVLLDFVALNGGPLINGTEIGLDMLEKALSGRVLRRGDAVLLRTGWLEAQVEGMKTDFNTEPGIGIAVAERLAEAGVALVGADNFAVEVLPFAKGTVFPVHQFLIRDIGMPLLEGLLLKPLGETGAREFLFVMAPLPIRGATGSPVNPVAVL